MVYIIGTRQLPECPVPQVPAVTKSAIRGGRGVVGSGPPVTSLTTRRELPRPVTSIGFSPSAMCLVGGAAGLPLSTIPSGALGNSLDRRGIDGGYTLQRSQAQPKPSGMNHLQSSSSSRSHLHQLGTISTGIPPPHHHISDSDEDEEDWC